MYNVHEIKYPETIKYLQALVKCLEYYILRIYICTGAVTMPYVMG